MRSADHSTAPATQPLLQVSGLSKTFPGLRARFDRDTAAVCPSCEVRRVDNAVSFAKLWGAEA